MAKYFSQQFLSLNFFQYSDFLKNFQYACSDKRCSDQMPWFKTSDIKQKTAESTDRRKTSLPKEIVVNADLHKPVLNKIMTKIIYDARIMREIRFCSSFKSSFVLKIFEFLSWLFGYVEKRLDQKAKVNFKIFDVTDCGQQIIATHILSNISRSKSN